VHRQVKLIVAASSPAATAAKSASANIPIVFTGVGGDPVKLGLVDKFNRPDGNITGVYILSSALEPKKLELLRELVHTSATIGYLFNPNNPNAETQVRDIREAARSLKLQLHVLKASAESDFDIAFATVAQWPKGGLVVGSDPFFTSRRNQLVAHAARRAVPAISEFREFTAAGGLMSYGTNLADAYRQAGIYAGRILKGENTADLPVIQSSKVELVINLKSAKALGLEISPQFLLRADEVIELAINLKTAKALGLTILPTLRARADEVIE
jgi:putative ABC transport system substrate-binding protein